MTFVFNSYEFKKPASLEEILEEKKSGKCSYLRKEDVIRILHDLGEKVGKKAGSDQVVTEAAEHIYGHFTTQGWAITKGSVKRGIKNLLDTLREKKNMKCVMKRFEFRSSLKYIFLLSSPNGGLNLSSIRPAKKEEEVIKEESMSSIPDTSPDWIPTAVEAGTSLRDSELDFGPLGVAISRAQVSPWQASIILEAYNQVMSGKTITPELNHLTQRKLRGEMVRAGESAVEDLEGQVVHTVCFDGKKNTVKNREEGGQQVTERNENITIIAYGHELAKPRYVGYAVAKDSSGVGVTTALTSYMDLRKIEWEKTLRMAIVDGTNSMTGRMGGAVAHLQSMARRTLQLNVCLIHHVELPLRHLFEKSGIVTKSGSLLTGPEGDATWDTIGEDLGTDVWTRPLADYQPIPADIVELEEAQWRSLSNDAQYLYRICIALTKGKDEFPPDLVSKKIGVRHQARWFTTASRTARLYASTKSPGHRTLTKLTKFIVRVYFKVQWAIRKDSRVEMGSHYLLLEVQLIQSAEFLTTSDRRDMLRVVKNNSYFAHPHMIILALLGDADRKVREKGVDILRKVQQYPEARVSPYFKPDPVMKATDVLSFCDMRVMTAADNSNIIPFPGRYVFRTSSRDTDHEWKLVTTPPLVKGMDIEIFLDKPFRSSLPCHTVAAERGVASTTAASSRALSDDKRLGTALARYSHIQQEKGE